MRRFHLDGVSRVASRCCCSASTGKGNFNINELSLRKRGRKNCLRSLTTTNVSSDEAPAARTFSVGAIELRSATPLSLLTENLSPNIKEFEDRIKVLEQCRRVIDGFNSSLTAPLEQMVGAECEEEILCAGREVMELLKSSDLKESLTRVQTLDDFAHKSGGESLVLNEQIALCKKARNKLHHMLLSAIDLGLPLNKTSLLKGIVDASPWDDLAPPEFDDKKHGPKTVDGSMEISLQAERLGFAIHRPLYQRLAMGIVLKPKSQPEDDESQNAISSKRNVSFELVGLCQRAFCGTDEDASDDTKRRLAADILCEPLMTLMKQQRWEEVMFLLFDWSHIFDCQENIDLLDLLGEDDTMEVINLGKYYLLDEWDDNLSDEFANDTPLSRNVEDLTHLLQSALTSVLRERRIRAECLNDALWHLARRKEEQGEGADEDYDSEDEYDSDDDDFYHDEDGTPNAHDDLPLHSFGTSEEWDARIYLRNSSDWNLPDLVPTLVEWNKGFPLSYTPEFERHLCKTLQLSPKQDDEDDDDDDE